MDWWTWLFLPILVVPFGIFAFGYWLYDEFWRDR